jgi:membrane protease YdiL (CAAX protease family)
MADRVRTRNVALFFVIAYGISWLLWLPQLLLSNGILQLPGMVGILDMFAPFGPFIAAFWLIGRTDGLEGAKGIWKQGWRLNFKKVWLFPTLFLLPLAGLITVVIMQMVGEPVQWEYGVSGMALIPTFAIIYLFNALPEEYGWRGFTLKPLLNRYSAIVASLITGLLWGLWHLPLHFIEGTVQANIPVYQFVLQQMLLSIFYTWLYVNTQGGVLVPILFHAIGNIAGAEIPYWITNQGRWINFAVLLVFAMVIVLYWGPEYLNRAPENMDEGVRMKGKS